MDGEPNRTTHRSNGSSQLDQLSIKYLGSILSLAAGSLCVALVVMYHQEKATFIVMACSNLLHGLGFFALCLICSKRRGKTSFLSLSHLSCICIELVTLGAAVCHFDNGRKHAISPNTHLHQNLIIALDALLLFALFINGMAIASLRTGTEAQATSIEDISHLGSESATQHGKFVPLKNSSQTLTPSMEIFQSIQSQCGSKLWTMKDTPASRSTDDISFPSVVKHKLECFSSKDASPVSSVSRKGSSIKSRLRSSSGSSSPRASRSLISRLRSRKLQSVFDSRKKSAGDETSNKNINGRYVTRLSTIPDLSKSVLNVILSSSEGQHKQEKVTDSSAEQNMQHSAILPDPALELERDAIGRINSALLPPCLRVMEIPPLSETVNSNKQAFAQGSQYNDLQNATHSSPDILEANDLGEIPRIPTATHGANSSGCSTDFNMHLDFPQLVTMDMWRENKERILERADQLQRHALLPAFDLSSPGLVSQNDELPGSTFSFPSKSYPTNLDTKTSTDQKDFDTISALEEYFRDLNEHEEEEMQIIEDGLKHDQSSSAIGGNLSKEIIRTSTRHSPTKSMISVISAASQQRYLNATGDQRRHSQSNFFLPTSSAAVYNSSSKSSPTRSQRLKRIGKKLSLSNLSDTVINHSIASDATGDLFAASKHDLVRGRSIDFSYVHNLQSNHSPTKSASGQSMCGSNYDRRNSLAADHGLRTASGLFFLHNGTGAANFAQDPTINTTWTDPLPEGQNTSHSASTEPSNSSTTEYPDVVMSEYDRERWNTILSLESSGKLNV
ncbi:hypothetical protein HG536_0F02140 [Torulaspora globosa]|uniref:Uncharacterized protein n=1 Tax=Torulaspora globosa TaxID=48254 RepID=A0A7G3ZK53_9SACH|nr:uncharacterized protein HG536_0F02140 [Torulaspora globosa]QLL33889.1 hypothetical protein HG536_0F02140 [Torulaspora globosa]